MNDLSRLQEQIEGFAASTPLNRLSMGDFVGERMYQAPLIAAAEASDPMFEVLRREGVVGPHLLLPGEWLPGARTVISLFFPLSDVVRQSNRPGAEPSTEWLNARYEGQGFIAKAAEFAVNCLREQGFAAVAPMLDERFRSVHEQELEGWGTAHFSSNWSERHVGFVCGLGTFGLSRGLITEKGMAGRMASIITDAVFPPTGRAYTDPYEYCTRCGACIARCPVQAVSFEKGKEHPPCSAYLEEMGKRFSPRYGCGKCQVAVPCETGIPRKAERVKSVKTALF